MENFEQKNAEFSAFFKNEMNKIEGKEPEAPKPASVETAKPQMREMQRKTSDFALRSEEIVSGGNFERNLENSRSKEQNFGIINPAVYAKRKEEITAATNSFYGRKIEKNDPLYYTEIVAKAVKDSQVFKTEAGSPENPEAFMLKILADRLRRKYNESPDSSNNPVEISCYGAVGSELDKEKGVVAIMEVSNRDSIKADTFYLMGQGYKRDVNRDTPMPAKFFDDMQHLGVPGVSVPVPFGGFNDREMMIVLKDTLPKKIGDDAAGKILRNFKETPQQV